MTPVGWRIYYRDGSVVSSRNMEWSQASSDYVEIVTVYFQETYKIWHGDQQDTENYCHLFHGVDYYWMKDNVIGAGMAADVPTGLPDNTVKVGMLMDDADFARIYDQAKEQRVF